MRVKYELWAVCFLFFLYCFNSNVFQLVDFYLYFLVNLMLEYCPCYGFGGWLALVVIIWLILIF